MRGTSGQFLQTLATLAVAAISVPSAFAQVRVVTEDITNFWTAYDKIVATPDAEEKNRILRSEFLDKATPGQLSMIEARRYRPEEFLKAIADFPKFYASIRPNTLRAPEYAAAISAGTDRLKAIYPALKPADVYFTMGVFRSGGTALNGHVLLGSEISMADAQTDTSEIAARFPNLKAHLQTNPINGLTFLAVHEFVHTQQPGRWGYDLLSQCVHEGVAEYVASRAMDTPSECPAVVYGLKRPAEVREVFEREMFSPWFYRWVWNNTNNPFNLRDMGYYVGYAIADAFFENSPDEQAALSELINLNCENREAVEALVDRSGYLSRPIAQLRETFEASRPRVTRIREFENGAQDVDPGITIITFEFSEPMDIETRSTDPGELGLDHYPEVSSQKFADDARSITYTVKLKPASRYQMKLQWGYRNPQAIPMVPYEVDFRTGD